MYQVRRKGSSILIKALKYIRENNAMYWSIYHAGIIMAIVTVVLSVVMGIWRLTK